MESFVNKVAVVFVMGCKDQKGGSQMKKVGVMAAVGMIVSFLISSNIALAGQIKNRQIRQQKRICQGISNGELTGRKVGILEREQCRIQKSKRRAWSDGRLTPMEGARLHSQQDRASGHIYRLKHNNITR